MAPPPPVFLSWDTPMPSKSAHFVSRTHGTYTVEGKLQCMAPPSMLFDILSDYDNCARVFGSIAKCEVRKDADGSLIVSQECKWGLGFFKGTFPASMSVYKDEESLQLKFKLRQSTFMRIMEGWWQIVPAIVGDPTKQAQAAAAGGSPVSTQSGSGSSVTSAGGTTGGGTTGSGVVAGGSVNACIVTHQLSVHPKVSPPFGTGIIQGIFVRQVDTMLEDLLREVNRRLKLGQQGQLPQQAKEQPQKVELAPEGAVDV